MFKAGCPPSMGAKPRSRALACPPDVRPGSVRASAAPKKASEPKKAAGSKVEPKIESKIATKIEPKITSKFTSKIAPKLAPKAEVKSEPKAEHKKISEEKGMASKVA